MSKQNQASAAAELPVARVPRRERGRQRVESLLDAAAALFAENGFEATTMTAIAQRAGASIGSLYQFFPTRQVLADALRARFEQHVDEALTRLAADGRCRTPEGLAAGLVELMKGLREERTAALALVDPNDPRDAHRLQIRNLMRTRIAALICQAVPETDADTAAQRAVLTLHLLKLVHQLPHEEAPAALEDALRDWLARAFVQPPPTGRLRD